MPITIQSTGTGTKTWSVSSGTLPNGISLNTSTGVLSGTPTTAGTFSFTLQVSVAGCGTDTQAYTVNVCDTLEITTTTLGPFTQGTAI
jgi:hypothetical protein